ncbi:hypothetical protein V7S43_005702 [Phytophthora oleae]|uniref:Uncharacterized protein n=1 Tax=Phytophthora oleae TaxID=2107226 RepID=A0ABD3FUB2_9STRA
MVKRFSFPCPHESFGDDDAKMTPEEPLTQRGSRLTDDGENDKLQASVLEQNSGDKAVEVDVTLTAGNYKFWSMDDVEGAVAELLDEIVVGSASESMETLVHNRLCGYVAAWGLSIIDEALASAIARTGDTGVDSSDHSVLNNPRALLGRSVLPLENLDTPKKCPMDESYQRSQVPMRAAKQNHYDNEALHHAVKSATRSHTHPASVTSSRLTVKSKMRKKQNVTTTTYGESTGPQPGVPYSTEIPHKGRHHIVSPRKVMAVHHPASADNTVGAGLQLNIDTEFIHQEKTVESTGSRRSPPPLSKSPSSITSLRRRPQPPGSAQSMKTPSFGEREEEVKVEFAIQKAPPRRTSMSTTGALPYIDRIAPRPSLPYPAFSVFGTNTCIDGGGIDQASDYGLDSDPLDQNFHAMPLSPGVKVRAGEESNDGPELPLFASQMRRSTFVRMETCTLPTQTSDPLTTRASSLTVQDPVQRPRKDTFLTETIAWEFSAEDRRLTETQVTQGRSHHFDSDSWIKSDDVLSAEMTTSCSCASSTSLTLFRKQSKVQRPCRSCSNESNRRETMNFSNLVKQRAFHLKPPCLPTSSSPSKRAPGASPRRVMSAPASSPLARRNLLISKKATQLPNKDLERATQIM